jgi:hypothetical protein
LPTIQHDWEVLQLPTVQHDWEVRQLPTVQLLTNNVQ